MHISLGTGLNKIRISLKWYAVLLDRIRLQTIVYGLPSICTCASSSLVVGALEASLG